ncbi:acyltransferase [Limosilactobacillus pontis]|uniref:Acyltransferase 3 n=1 Tax=Limosilactobacillus pontis DSM 8475 TaxID=1423794 RepID=A0A922TMW7_9LACO|nr:acyltransferase [Limosilactobacillus pontis]KRM35578.1 acyltransferase 3 [Limosilactobacillus pontis DSM 8475]QFV01329.1 acyltransferase family protein [Limosilactobacillus pontis]
MSVNKRLHYIDVLNCIAIYFVLVLHTSQLAFLGSPKDSNYVTTLILQTLCGPAVYIFFMNSGATLLNYRRKYSTKTFMLKRIKRVGIPFLIWSIIYYIYDISHRAYPGPIQHPHPSLTNFINAFANNNINNLFWFFYSIIALYLVTPIISVLIDHHQKTLFGIVVASFMLTDVLNYVSKLTGLKLMTSFMTQPLITSNFVGYFVMGYLIKERFFSEKEENYLIIIGLFALAISLINDLTLHRFVFINNIGPYLYSVSLYILIKRITEWLHTEKSYDFKIFKILSGASLGIYIIHPILYEMLDKYLFHATPYNWGRFLRLMNNPYQIFLVPVIAYVILSIVVVLIKKNRYIRILIP